MNSYNVEQLDALAVEGNFTLATTDEICNIIKPKLEGGWDCIWIGTKGEENKGNLVLLPRDDRTGELYKHGMIKNAIQAGLDPQTALKWAEYRGKFKHELLNDLVTVEHSNHLQEAFRNYPGYGKGTRRSEWMKQWEIIPEWMSAPRQYELAQMIKHCLFDC